MKRYQSMNYFLGALCAVQLVGCQSHGPLEPTGAVSLRFDMPARAVGPLAFSIKAIPAGTNRFDVEISGKGLDKAITQTIDAKDGHSQSKTINGLPVGAKQVTVRAMLNQDVLASASTSVTIEAGKVAQAELDLTALQAEVTAQLESVLPLDLQIKCKFTGEGITTPVEKTITIPANQTTVALGVLPLGSKEAHLEMMAGASGQQVSAPALEQAFDVNPDGGTLSISASKVLSSFSDHLESLLNQANPLVILAWLQQLRSNPARLAELYRLLPPATKARLRANPLVSDSLPPDDSTPGTSSSPAPTTSTP